MSAEDALKFAAEHGVEFVDVRFTDLLGQWHHLTIPIEEFGPDACLELETPTAFE